MRKYFSSLSLDRKLALINCVALLLVCGSLALNELANPAWPHVTAAGWLLLVCSAAAFLLEVRLQKSVIAPTLALTKVVSAVAAKKDYSIRVPRRGQSEVDRLIDEFNGLLIQIQLRDAQLQSASLELAHRVDAQNERDLLRALLDNSPDAIYFKDTQSRFIKSSRAQAAHFGLENADDLVGKTDFDFFTETHALRAVEGEKKIMQTGEPITALVSRDIRKDGREIWILTDKMPLRNKAGEIIGTLGISRDITAAKQTEAKLEEARKKLVEASRRAGMAEVATGVLHNVGNVLNSVNVSATLIGERVRHSKAVNLARVCLLLDEHKADLGAFLSVDPKGRVIPAYLGSLAENLTAERAATIGELENLSKNIEHIKAIVATQQNYARHSGFTETIPLTELVEDSLRMNADSLARHEVNLVRDYRIAPVVELDKNKVIQILTNLIRNAKYACDESGRSDKTITVRITSCELGARIDVADNGVGIPPENLTRIFNHGFSTRNAGHGFGLHGGALAAREVGGSLTVQSGGIGHGATFTLDLPCKTEALIHDQPAV